MKKSGTKLALLGSCLTGREKFQRNLGSGISRLASRYRRHAPACDLRTARHRVRGAGRDRGLVRHADVVLGAPASRAQPALSWSPIQPIGPFATKGGSI